MAEKAEACPDLTVVVLSYNVRPFLVLALRTALAARGSLAVEIIVVDNASSDGSADMVAGDFPGVRLIRSASNLGFAGGNNLGVRAARGRYILILNPDVLVHPNAFEALVRHLDAHPEVGAAGGRIINTDGTTDPGGRRGFPSPSAALYRMVGLSYVFPRSRRFGRYTMRYLPDDEVTDAEALSGCFMCVRREVVEQVGELDEAFFMYGEDIDWSYRIASAGWKLAYVPSAEIIHFGGRSTRTLSRLRQLYEFHRAMHVFVRKHIAPGRPWPVKALIETGIFLRAVSVSVWRLICAALVPALDLAALVLGFGAALVLRTRGGWTLPGFSAAGWLLILAVFAGAWFIGAALVGLYGRRQFDARRAVSAAIVAASLCIVAIFFIRTINFSRIVTGTTWAVTGALLGLWRWIARRDRSQAEGGHLVLGCGERAEGFLRLLRAERRDHRIIGVVRGRGDPSECTSVEGYPVIGDMDDLPLLLRTVKPAELIVAWEHYRYSDLLTVARQGGRYPRRIRLVPEGLAGVGGASPEDWPLINLDLRKRTWL